MIEGLSAQKSSARETGCGSFRTDPGRNQAELPPHRSLHGLRKAAYVRLTDAGCDVFEIMATTGHSDIKDVQTYVTAANKKKAAKRAITTGYGAV
jgi:integrase